MLSIKHASFTGRLFAINPAVVVAATLLCAAAFSKNFSGCAGCPQFCIGGSCLLNLTIATLEFFVGAVAFARSSSRIVWLTLLCVFLVFAGWNIFLVWNEHSSCGCFGRISVSPWVMLVLDFVVLFLIVNSTAIVVPISTQLSNCSKVVGIVVFAVSLIVWIGLLSSNTERSGWPIKRIGNDVFVDITQLKNLSAEQFFEIFGVESALSETKWLILRGSCDHCVEAAKTISLDVNVLAIEPDGSLTYILTSRNINYVVASSELNYVFQAPLFVEIKGGRIVDVNLTAFSRIVYDSEEE